MRGAYNFSVVLGSGKSQISVFGGRDWLNWGLKVFELGSSWGAPFNSMLDLTLRFHIFIDSSKWGLIGSYLRCFEPEQDVPLWGIHQSLQKFGQAFLKINLKKNLKCNYCEQAQLHIFSAVIPIKIRLPGRLCQFEPQDSSCWDQVVWLDFVWGGRCEASLPRKWLLDFGSKVLCMLILLSSWQVSFSVNFTVAGCGLMWHNEGCLMPCKFPILISSMR